MRKSNVIHEYQKNVDLHQDKLTIYWILAVLRVLLNFIPETGYIHPDEYFQSIEVVAGIYIKFVKNVRFYSRSGIKYILRQYFSKFVYIIAGDQFDIDVYKPWEFNVTFPVRSIIFPQLTVGTSYLILKIFGPYIAYIVGTSLRSPYYFLLFPRLLMCCFSFVSDYCLYKICRIWNHAFKARLIIFASSYIMLCYVTRTFSNSTEFVLTSLLLFYVADCMQFSEKVVTESDRLYECHNAAKTGTERVKYYKLRASLPSHSLNHCFILATLTVVGIFNRPTFIAFALAPIFFWLQRGLGTKSIGLLDFHIRIITFVLCSIPAAILIIIIDSFYYGYLTIGEIVNLDISINNFVVTPYNFIKYNAITENLQQHGLHPRFLHFLVNVPLLFNVLGVLGIFLFAKIIYSALRGRWLELPRVNNISILMMASFIVPISLISIFPHQEPRFIIPALLPLVFLCTPYIKSTSDIAPIIHDDNKKVKEVKKKKRRIGKLELIWYILNIFFTFFYGFCHQGGVLPLTSHLASELKVKPHLTRVHVFTSFTYPIPTGLLHLKNTQKTYSSSGKHKYKLIKDFYLHEFGGMNIDLIYDKISSTVYDCEEMFKLKKTECRIYYVLPINMFDELNEFVSKNASHKLNYSRVRSFYPHISTEKLRWLSIFPICTNSEQLFLCTSYMIENITENLFRFLYQFQLLLLKIEN